MDKKSGDDQHPATDDQELAKVLAGMNDEVSQLPATDDPQPTGSGLQFEETPGAHGQDPAVAAPVADAPAPTPDAPAPEPPATPPAEESVPAPEVATPTPEPAAEPASLPTPVSAGTSDLEGIKKDALEELRPLVNKLDLPAEEKFDTLLLVIRSTDDKSLVGAAHDAAKSIADEQKRAAALLDIIKEIDYFAGQQPS